jgi:hypothetical protein
MLSTSFHSSAEIFRKLVAVVLVLPDERGAWLDTNGNLSDPLATANLARNKRLAH